MCYFQILVGDKTYCLFVLQRPLLWREMQNFPVNSAEGGGIQMFFKAKLHRKQPLLIRRDFGSILTQLCFTLAVCPIFCYRHDVLYVFLSAESYCTSRTLPSQVVFCVMKVIQWMPINWNHLNRCVVVGYVCFQKTHPETFVLLLLLGLW